MSSEDEDENVLPRPRSVTDAEVVAANDEEEEDVMVRDLPRAMQRLQLNRSRFLTRLRPRRANRKSGSSHGGVSSGRVRSVAFKGVRLEREQPSSAVRVWRKARSGATSPEAMPRGARAQREASAHLSAQRCLEARLRPRVASPQRVRTRAASL